MYIFQFRNIFYFPVLIYCYFLEKLFKQIKENKYKMIEKGSTLKELVLALSLSFMIGNTIGNNIGSYLSTKKAFSQLHSKGAKIEFSKDFIKHYTNQNIFYKANNLGSYLKANDEYLKNFKLSKK